MLYCILSCASVFKVSLGLNLPHPSSTSLLNETLCRLYGMRDELDI